MQLKRNYYKILEKRHLFKSKTTLKSIITKQSKKLSILAHKEAIHKIMKANAWVICLVHLSKNIFLQVSCAFRSHSADRVVGNWSYLGRDWTGSWEVVRVWTRDFHGYYCTGTCIYICTNYIFEIKSSRRKELNTDDITEVQTWENKITSNISKD